MRFFGAQLLLALPGLSFLGQLRGVRDRQAALALSCPTACEICPTAQPGEIRYDFAMPHKPVKTVVFPVAGRGTRFLPVTKASPKEMLPIVDKPLIQYAVDEALSAGADTLVFITGSSKRAIEDHFDTQPGTRGRAAGAGQTGAAGYAARDPAELGFVRLHPPAGAAWVWVMPCCARGRSSAMRPSWCISRTI